jgi:acetate---CoA ligase (ADP-forming)
MSEPRQANLQRLFAPRSIAVIGASTAEEKVGYQLVQALRSFTGRVYPINPKASEIAGRVAYASLAQLPEPPDLAILAIPAASCPAALADVAAAHAGAALICSGGFAESGGRGATLQHEIEAAIANSTLRLLGPNTVGFTNPGAGCHACFLPTVREFAAGGLGVVAQSGGVFLTLAFLAQRMHLGLRLGVGLGNSVDVDAADVIDYLASDEQARAIVLHLEGVRSGRKLYESIQRASTHKPVIALPVGRSEVAEFAASHTGNLMGVHALTCAALRQAGAVVVETSDAAIDAAAALSARRIAAKANPGVGVVTAQAGPGLIILDALRTAGVSVPQLEEGTVANISRLLPPMTFIRNPVDTGRPSPAYPDVLLAAGADPNIDAIVAFALDEPAALDAASALSRVAQGLAKPLVFGTLGSERSIAATAAVLMQHGVPTLPSPDRAASAMRALVEDAKARHRRSSLLKQDQAEPHGSLGPVRGEAASKQLLSRFGVHAPRSLLCATHDEAQRALRELHAPVVIKVHDERIAHKTDVGGVHLNVRTNEELDAALARIDAIPGERAARGYLVEEMAPAGVDLILGAKRDASFGATVLVGLGGVEAEALNDTALRLAPLTRVEATEMLGELRGAALLDGWRGRPAVDRSAAVNAILAVSRLLLATPTLLELDINPLRLTPEGALALDALMIWNE